MNQNNATNNIATKVGERGIVITRIYDAPRDLVFDAWTKQEHLSKWWGPQGFTTTFQEFDMKPGGTWKFIMHGPDGVDYPNTIVFVEVDKPERIVLQFDGFPNFVGTATFEDLVGKTKLTYSTIFETAAEFDEVKPYAVPGAEQTMDRLGEHLTSMS
jgi:uncharacterized protein YndB with AHSA1/START domain